MRTLVLSITALWLAVALAALNLAVSAAAALAATTTGVTTSAATRAPTENLLLGLWDEAPTLTPTARDTERAEAMRARLEGRWADATEILGGLLREDPLDGLAVRELVLMARERGQLAEEVSPEGISLRPAAREFARGLALLYASRYASAAKAFRAALDAEPGWGWAALYRARVGRHLGESRESCRADLRAAFLDPDSHPAAAVLLADHDLFEDPRPHRAELAERAAALEAVPWIRPALDWAIRRDALDSKAFDPPAWEALWTELTAAHGTLASDVVPNFVWLVRSRMPAADWDAFLQRRLADPLTGRHWIMARARHLHSLGFRDAAQEIMDSPAAASEDGLLLLATVAAEREPPALVRAATERMLERSLDSGHVELAEQVFRDLDDPVRLQSLRAEVARENPARGLRREFFARLDADVDEAAALLDSLDAADVFFSGSPVGHRALVAERAGTPWSLEELQARGSHAETARAAHMLARRASEAGDDQRAIYLEDFSRSFTGFVDLNQVNFLWRAVERRSLERAGALADELLQRGVPCLAADAEVLSALLMLERYSDAVALIEKRLDSARLESGHALALVYWTLPLDRPDLLDRLLAVAAADRPEAFDVRYWEAHTASYHGEKSRACSLAETLLESFPGRPTYRDLSLAACGHVEGLRAEPRDPAQGDPFLRFDHDLMSTGWIVAALSEDRSDEIAPAVLLMDRSSYALNHVGGGQYRERKTIRILHDAGVEAFQTARIPYRPSTGTPRVIAARVVHPDGRVVDVPRTDILVTAPESEADVSDLRELVIPFPDLRAGSALDYVYDMELGGWFGTGISRRFLFGNFIPVDRQVFEVAAPRSTRLRTVQGGGSPEPVREDGTGSKMIRWDFANPPELRAEEMSPSLFETAAWAGFTTYPDWPELAPEYRGAVWSQVVVTEELRERAHDLVRDKASDVEKLAALYDHVVEEIEYLAIEFARGTVVPTPSDEVLRRGYGDCKDMVGYLVALLEAVDIPAMPALVASEADAIPILEDFPELETFNHVIVFVPDVQGGRWCDPTSGIPCPDRLPENLAGKGALRIPRTGGAILDRLPTSTPDDHGFDVTVDLHPEDDRIARLELRGTFRGALRDVVAFGLQQPDPATQATWVERVLGYGLWDSCELADWEADSTDCDRIVLQAAYRDTSWYESNETSQMFRLISEVADPFLDYPDPDDRVAPVNFPHPFRNTWSLRLRGSGGWEPRERVAEIRVQGEGYRGTVRTDRGESDGHTWVEVRQEFEVSARSLDSKKYTEFHDGWLRFLVGVFQPYGFRRALDTGELERLEAFAREHPEDAGFAVQAAARMLGTDAGGDGEPGALRRRTARKLLEPQVGRAEAGAMPSLQLAAVNMEEGRYLAADSLLTAAVQEHPSDLLTLATARSVKQQVGDWEGELAILGKLNTMVGTKEISLRLIQLLYQMGRPDDAQREEKRWLALSGGADSSNVVLARISGQVRARNCTEAFEALEAHGHLLESEIRQVLETDVRMRCAPTAEAIGGLEELIATRPMDPALLNNLAWVYTLAGTDLDRAEELVRAASILAEDDSSVRNTLGALQARRMRWKEAREIFMGINDRDDRPSTRVANDYFIALCDWNLGKKDDALEAWRRIAAQTREPEWKERSRRSLELVAEGGKPEGAIFDE